MRTIWVLIGFAAICAAWPGPAVSADPKSLLGIEVTVIDAATGDPVEKVAVVSDRISTEEEREREAARNRNRFATAPKSDTEGRVFLSQSRPGTYALSMLHPVFLTPSDGIPSVVITEDAPVQAITIRAERGATIAGRVLTEAGDRGVGGIPVDVNGSALATTDAQGFYRIEGLETGEYRVERGKTETLGRAPQQSRKRVYVRRSSAIGGIDFVLAGSVVVEGLVVDEHGQPVEGVTVSASFTEGIDPAQAETHADGRYRITGASPDVQMFVRAQKEGLVIVERKQVNLGDPDRSDHELVMRPEARLRGRIVQAGGAPLANASVGRGSPYGGGRAGTTDGNGYFDLRGLKEGRHVFSVRPEWDRRGEAPVVGYVAVLNLAYGDDVSGLRWVYDPDGGEALGGVVHDQHDLPLVGADVYVTGISRRTTTTDENGAFVVRGLLPGEYNVTARVGHAESYSNPFQAGDMEVELRVSVHESTPKKRRKLLGRVRDATIGELVTSFDFAHEFIYPHHNAASELEGLNYKLLDEFEEVHHSEAEFTVIHLDVGEHHVLVRANGYGAQYQRIVISPDSPDVLQATFRLPPGGMVRGQVVDPGGHPVTGAHLVPGPLSDKWFFNDREALTITQSDGQFAFDWLEQRPQLLTAYHPDFQGTSVTVTPEIESDTSTTIALRPAAVVAGQVTIAGVPEENAEFFVNYLDEDMDRRYSYGGLTDASGHYQLKPLPGGDATVRVRIDPNRKRGRLHREYITNCTLREGATTTLDLDFLAGEATLEGRVTLDGNPVVRASCTLIYPRPLGEQTITKRNAKEGTYQLDRLPEGSATLSVVVRVQVDPDDRRQGYTDYTQTVPVTVGAGGLQILNVDLSSHTSPAESWTP